jgi:hypothetical protein
MRQIRGLSPLRDGDHIHIGGIELAFDSRAIPTGEAVNSQATLSQLREANERRLRLFAAACSRQFGIPEREARPGGVASGDSVWTAAADIARQSIEESTRRLVGREWPHPEMLLDAEAWAAYDAAEAAVCQLLRDIVPFENVTMNPSLLKWRDGTIIKLARAIHDQGRFGDMPVLADALQQAGCDNEAVLTHCRQQGSVHGADCWVLGLVLENANS